MKFVRFAGIIVLVCLCGAPAAAGAQSWSVPSGDVQVRCRMTVGGSFNAVTSSLSGTLQPASPDGGDYSGELRVDLATFDTGIDLRDNHLRNNYLEVARGPEYQQAVLSSIVLDDPLPDGGGRHETAFSATLSLHGVQSTIAGEAELTRRDGRIEVRATFPVSLEEFDIPPPRYLGVGVRDTVEITVSFDAMGGDTSSNGGTR